MRESGAPRRDINLFERALWQSPRAGLPAWWPVMAIALAVVVCGGMSVFQGVRHRRVEAHLQALERQISAEQAVPSPFVPPEQEAALRAELVQLRGHIVGLRGVRSEHAITTVLESLARASMEDVWLTRIRIDRDRGVLTLVGQTHDAKRVSQYLAALARQAPFAGMALHRVGVKRLDETADSEAPRFEFEMESEPVVAVGDAAGAP
jgi:hypothetical protein